MEHLALKFNSRFVVNELKQHIPNGQENLFRLKDMASKFKDSLLHDDVWNKEKLYLMLMFVHYFASIKTHVVEFANQDRRWQILIDQHLNDLVTKHLNFELNAVEMVVSALNLFFII